MSYYYKYNFVSPETIFAKVKEELKSYFDTGLLDDILFPVYVEDCLRELGRSSFKIVSNIFKMENFSCKLPEDFEGAREVWLCTSQDISYKLPGSFYEQTTYKITPEENRCTTNNYCFPQEVKVTYKTDTSVSQTYSINYLLKPGNICVNNNLSLDCLNRNLIEGSTTDTFDIRDGKIITNFREGYLYMTYYVKEYDCNQYQMIPDNIRIKNFLSSYLKYKCFETIYNNVTDETFKQAEAKLMFYMRQADEARIIAETEIKKQTIHQVVHSIKSQRKRFKRFYIS